MADPSPVYIGEFPAMAAGDVADRYIDITNDLVAGESISSVTFTTTDGAGNTETGVTSDTSLSTYRADFRVTAPATADVYTISAAFTISDGQLITRKAKFRVV